LWQAQCCLSRKGQLKALMLEPRYSALAGSWLD